MSTLISTSPFMADMVADRTCEGRNEAAIPKVRCALVAEAHGSQYGFVGKFAIGIIVGIIIVILVVYQCTKFVF